MLLRINSHTRSFSPAGVLLLFVGSAACSVADTGTGIDTGTGVDTGAGVDTGTGTDTGTATGADTGTDTGVDTDTSVPTGSDTGTEPPAFVPECVQLGDPSLAYYDAEVLSQPPRLTFVDAIKNGTHWLATLDPVTGEFVSADGRDQQVATGVTSLVKATNGAEFGVDQSGAALYFSKEVDAVDQVWRAPLMPEGDLVATPLTTGEPARLSPLARIDPGAKSTRILYATGSATPAATLAWLDTGVAGVEHPFAGIDQGVSGPRWIPGSDDFLIATQPGQIARYDTATDSAVVLTRAKRPIRSDSSPRSCPRPSSSPSRTSAASSCTSPNLRTFSSGARRSSCPPTPSRSSTRSSRSRRKVTLTSRCMPRPTR